MKFLTFCVYNIQFDGEDFMFRLTRLEVECLSRSNFLTSMQMPGVKGGRAYLPFKIFIVDNYINIKTLLKTLKNFDNKK